MTTQHDDRSMDRTDGTSLPLGRREWLAYSAAFGAAFLGRQGLAGEAGLTGEAGPAVKPAAAGACSGAPQSCCNGSRSRNIGGRPGIEQDHA